LQRFPPLPGAGDFGDAFLLVTRFVMNHAIILCAGLSVATALWGGLLVVGEIYCRLNKRRSATEIYPSDMAAGRQAAKRRMQPKTTQRLRSLPPRYVRSGCVAPDWRRALSAEPRPMLPPHR
jgi:hypothetical protein